MIRDPLAAAVKAALAQAVADGAITLAEIPDPQIDAPRNPEHGDFATNVAMTLAKPTRMAPLAIAEAIVARINHPMIGSAEVAKPGFINLRLSLDWLRQTVIGETHAQGPEYGKGATGAGTKVMVEYVSANPTGNLHIGHGRNAALGSAIANLLRYTGHTVSEEFYINDFGNQLTMLGVSILLRALEQQGLKVPFPKNGYGGDFIKDAAADPDTLAALKVAGMLDFLTAHGASLAERLTPYLETDLPGDPKLIDALFSGATDLVNVATDLGRAAFLAQQQAVLTRFGCRFETWFSERTLHAADKVLGAIDMLDKAGFVFDLDGAKWFKSTEFGDDKDRVLIRKDGRPTYIAGDIAYHLDKYGRDFDTYINVWGADHHGDIARLKGALQALGRDPAKLEVILYQMVNLYRGGVPVRMSKRTGEMVTLDELIDEVGIDASRYFLVLRAADSPVDFDIDLAKKEASDNPVFYVQYAHARICSIERMAESQMPAATGPADLSLLEDESERALLLRIARFSDEVAEAAQYRAPYKMVQYADSLATDFHSFYTRCRVLDPANPALSQARLTLAGSVRIVLHNLLTQLVGVSAPVLMEKREEATA
ncbi:MAG: arginine--tRNA ligase [Candidatus Sericytochromatia bacterium]|nr:arginine--tRNA ligase [Candidatus Sericytochromatia bacterium]